MARRTKEFAFNGRLAGIDNVFIKTAIFIPADVVEKLPAGRIRVKGTINDAVFSLAVLHLKDGSRYFSVGAPLRKAAGIKLGDPVAVQFRVVDASKLDLPEELKEVLAQDEDARAAWEKLTTGYRRSLVHYITSVKNVDSRIRRSLDLLARAKAGLLHGQRTKSKRS